MSVAATGWLLTAIAPVWFRGTLMSQVVHRPVNIEPWNRGRWRAVAGFFALAFYALSVTMFVLNRPH